MNNRKYIVQLASPAKSLICNLLFKTHDFRWEVEFFKKGFFRISNLSTGHFKELPLSFMKGLKKNRLFLSCDIALTEYQVLLLKR